MTQIGEYEASLTASYKAARARLEAGPPPAPSKPVEAPEPAPFNPLRPGGHWTREGWKAVLYDVCVEHRVMISDVMAKDKRPHILECRWEVIRRLRADGASLPDIGRRLGLHHTTVLHALRRSEGRSARELKPSTYRNYEVAA